MHDNSTDENQDPATGDEAILVTARERFKLAEDAYAEIDRVALEDLEFRAGNQWPAEVRQERDLDRRPCLTINRIPQFVRQVTNDQRQNRPSIKVYPVDDKADVDTAKIFQGIIKHIEYNSNADTAYDTAFDGAVTKGLGYFRIITDHCDPFSFDQEIKIKRILNSFSVRLDPNSKEPDGSDANYGFIVEDYTKEEFKQAFPNSKFATGSEWDTLGNQAPGWSTATNCRVAEYFYKEFKPDTLCLLSNGHTALKSKLEGTELPDDVTIKAERPTVLPSIKWCKLNGGEILEKTEWLGQWIPIIPVYGDEIDVNGRRILEGIIRHAKDPQRMYNYWASAETETIALAPRAPFIGAAGQFEGFEAQWNSANRRNHPYLQYNPKGVNGQPMPPPQRNVFEAPTQSITMARAQASEDLKATTGIYDAALGARSNENSGIAIQRRNMQTQTSNFHYVDNLSRSIRHAGRILVDLIPHIYDTGRAQRIIGEDGEQQIVKINEIFEKGGEKKIYNLSAGKYDVVVEAGPSFATKRQEAAQSMLEMSKANPQLWQVAGDLMAKNMDWPGAKEVADRLKKTLPPGLAEPDEKDQKPIPPQIQAKMAQMDQMIQQLSQEVQGQADIIENKRMELESKERIEMKKLEVQVELKRAELDAQASTEILRAEVAEINRRLELLHINEPIENENEPGAGPEGAEMPVEQSQPTGGPAPGNSMEQP